MNIRDLRLRLVAAPMGAAAVEAGTAFAREFADGIETVVFQHCEKPALIKVVFHLIGCGVIDFDREGKPYLHTNLKVRKLDPLPSAWATLEEAERTGEPTISLVHGMAGSAAEDKHQLRNGYTFSSTDVCLIVALPDRKAIAWHARAGGRSPAGNAESAAPDEIKRSARVLYLARRPNISVLRAARQHVIDYAQQQLLEDHIA